MPEKKDENAIAKRCREHVEIRKKEAIKWYKHINALMSESENRRDGSAGMVTSTAIDIAENSPFIINDGTERQDIVDFYEDMSRYKRYKEEERCYDMFVRDLRKIANLIWREHSLCDADLKEEQPCSSIS